MLPISCCLIVQNEAGVIGRCLENVLPHVQEVCIVDGGSEDATLAIIRRDYIDRWNRKWHLKEHPFDRNFGAQKNRALELATQDWVLWIDADEVYEPDLYQALPRLMVMGPDAFSFARKTRIDGFLHNIIDPDHQIRFWKNHKGICFGGKIHESPTGFRQLIKCNLLIIHNKTFEQQEIDNRLYWDMGQEPPPDVKRIDGKWVRIKE